MRTPHQEGQGLVSYALFLVVMLILCLAALGIAIFVDFRTALMILAVVVGLWLLINVLSSRFVIELFRQIRIVSLILLTLLNLYMPEKHFSEVSIIRIIQRVKRYYQPTLRRRGISVKVVSDQILMVKTHPLFVEDILHHLVSNSIKYSQGVANPQIKIECNHQVGKLHCSIRDQAPPIPEQERDLVSAWFYRGKSSKGFGLGIGLSILRLLLTYLGGEYGLDTDSDQGNTFWFTLPVE